MRIPVALIALLAFSCSHLPPAQEAGRVAERIREALALKPFVIQR